MNPADYLTSEELQSLTRRSDARAAWLVLCQWSLVVAIFVAVALWTNPLSVLIGTILLGGRQLGFGILQHECGHNILFKNSALNRFVGIWVVSPPGFSNMAAYMRGHLQHHRLAGTREDPDLPNYRDYPITRTRLRRKLKRDITGQTGWRTLKGIGLGIINLGSLEPEPRACLLRGLAMNLAMFAVLLTFDQGWLFLMWIAAKVFVQPLISRVRQVAEHAAVPDLYDLDPRLNTRTVVANPLLRLIFCPHQVNYHLEHHCLAAVPIYRLRRMHELLKRSGAYNAVEFPRGYLELLRSVTHPAAVATAA